jgi:hypothetical protein
MQARLSGLLYRRLPPELKKAPSHVFCFLLSDPLPSQYDTLVHSKPWHSYFWHRGHLRSLNTLSISPLSRLLSLYRLPHLPSVALVLLLCSHPPPLLSSSSLALVLIFCSHPPPLLSSSSLALVLPPGSRLRSLKFNVQLNTLLL